MTSGGTLRAISDLHVTYQENREIVRNLIPLNENDWLIIAGDVGESLADIEWTLKLLSRRYAQVIWVPGNHELWTPRHDESAPRGVALYDELVRICRGLGVLTPEDPFPIWLGRDGPVRIAPLFLLYDYSFLAPGASTPEESLRLAYDAGVVCTDEFLLHPDPYNSRQEWCAARVAYTEDLLVRAVDDTPLVLVNHYPLVREPTRVLTHPEFAQWCGTESTADWHTRFGAAATVYGHLHIPRSTIYDGVPFEEVSLGYPREWRRSGLRDELARPCLPSRPNGSQLQPVPTQP